MRQHSGELAEAKGPARRGLLCCLADTACRHDALRALARIGVGDSLPKELVVCFASDAAEDRALACGVSASAGVGAVPHLERALRDDPDWTVRRDAASALLAIGGPSTEVVRRCLASGDAEGREAAFSAVAALPDTASRFVPELAAIAGSAESSPQWRSGAVRVLASAGEAGAAALVHLAAQEDEVGLDALMALEPMGAPGVRGLVELAMGDGPTRQAALVALVRAGAEAEKELRRRAADPRVRDRAEQCLRDLDAARAQAAWDPQGRGMVGP